MNLVELAQTLGLERTLDLQDRLVTRAQALACGYPMRRVEQLVTDRRWLRIHPCVYLVRAHRAAGCDETPLAARARIRAAWLWAGEDAIVSMTAALWWLGLSGVEPGVVEVWVPPARRKEPQPGVLVRRRRIAEADTSWLDGIRVTSKNRTAVDLSAARSTDGLDSLARKRDLDQLHLDGCLMRGSGSRGWVAAREAVANSVRNPWSAAERRFHADLIAAGLSRWVANERLKVGRRIRVPDVRFEDVPLVVEIDGKEHHGADDAFERDSERDTEYTAAGWTCLRFTYRQLVDRPDWVQTMVRATVARLLGAPMPPTT